MTHICLGGFSKMCRAPPKRPKTTHRTMADPSPLGHTEPGRRSTHLIHPVLLHPVFPAEAFGIVCNVTTRHSAPGGGPVATNSRCIRADVDTPESAPRETRGRGTRALACKPSGPPPRVSVASRGWGGSGGHAPCAPGTRVQVRAAGRAYLPAQPPPSLTRCCHPTLPSFKERL